MTEEYMIEQDEVTSLNDDDIFLVTTDPEGTPESKIISWGSIKSLIMNLENNLDADIIGRKRLSLESGVPTSTSDQTSKTTVYWTDGNKNLSVTVPSTTNTPFDVFYSVSGDSLSTVNWTNDSTRATALSYNNGYLVKSGDTDKIYLGTGRTTSASGNSEDSSTKRFLWNYYNRKLKDTTLTNAISHTNTNTAVAYWNSDTNNKVEFVIGVVEDTYYYGFLVQMTCAATSSASQGCVGVGLNSVSSITSAVYWSSAHNARGFGNRTVLPTLGYNYVAALERGLTGVTFDLVQLAIQINM